MADANELESVEYQLKTINDALKADPRNAELLELKSELENLINLTKELHAQQHVGTSASASGSRDAGASGSGSASASASTSTATAGPSKPSTSGSYTKPTTSFTTGTEVLAKWHGDNKMYPARIASVSGSSTDPVYTVIFNLDKSTEVVRSGDVKALSDSKKRTFVSDDGPASSGESKKVKKTEKKAVKEDERKARVAEQVAKQSSWQSFAKKGAKKGIHIPGVSGDSMFRSPDNPYGRVGVVGSGKGMTAVAEKKRFKNAEGEES